ncbi:MAG TPA: FAD/NAD(P)-binding oxidoreductase [Candidatus Limnocylindrales bacterium]|nr:FAD/NAD(P)-binding oxidoreductase [Candidatus Limnocylindrales bacterium]
MAQHYDYLIVGGGMTADAAVQGIREGDSSGSIGLLCAEPDPPYDRPPLTKGLWKDQKEESIWRKTAERNADLHFGHRAQVLDLGRSQVTDDHGDSFTFDKLLLATGGSPRQLPFGGSDILYYRSFRDYKRLRARTEKGRRFAVIGGGFIGSEIAAALALNHKEVVMLFPGQSIGDRIFPRDLSLFLNDFYRQKGVQVLPGQKPSGLEKQGDQFVLRTESRDEFAVDGVIAGLGIEPNVSLAESAGLPVENGIVVDEFLRTSHPDIYAAGDVAAFYNPALSRRLRVEHEDNANTMGRCAGRNMAGKPEAYVHLPFFYSDLFELGYEAVGDTDARLTTVADWKTPFREGVVYYQQEDKIRGVLLWNVWGKVDAARHLIESNRPFQRQELTKQLLEAA